MQFGAIDHIIFFGGGTRLLSCLDLARERGFRVEVVSAPRLLAASLDGSTMTVADAFRSRSISYVAVDDLAQWECASHVTPQTLGISFGAPWIFRRRHIDAFGGRLLNAHGTCLPENRGAATFSWQLLRGDRRGAFLFHLVDTGVDSGAIVMIESYTFPDTCRTSADYRAFHLAHEPAFLGRFLDRIRVNDAFPVSAQNEARATYFPRLATAHHAFIDWSWRAAEIARFIAAFDRPYDGAQTFHRGTRVTLRTAEVTMDDGAFHPFMAGLVIRVHQGTVAIATTDGTVLVREIRTADGSDGRSRLRPGHRFITPRAVLEDALAFEAVYDAHGLREGKPVLAPLARGFPLSGSPSAVPRRAE